MSSDRSVTAVRLTAVLACTFGTLVLGFEFVRYLQVFPGASVLAVAVELPLLVIGFAVLRLARPIRPPAWIWAAAALAWGGTAAAGCALLANQGLTGLWAKGAGVGFASDWSAPLTAPLNEEILKLCGVIMIVLAAPAKLNGPLDGWIYGALTGLGFQVTENVTYGLNSISLTGAADPDGAVASSVLVRVGQAGLGSHWTMTAVAGAGIGFLVARGRVGERGGPLLAAVCIAGAMIMHLLFDAPFLPLGVKVAVNFLLAGGLYVLLRSAYLGRARSVLTARIGSGLVRRDEARGLLSRRGRRRESRQVAPGEPRAHILGRQREILAEIDGEAA